MIRFVPALICCFVLFSPSLFAVTVTTELLGSDFSLDNSLQIKYTVRGDIVVEPDFRPLERDFELLGIVRDGAFGNDTNPDAERSWLLQLLARRAGEIIIPSISFGDDESESLQIQVKPSAIKNQPGTDIYLKVEPSSSEVYEKQGLFIKVRVYRSFNTGSSSISDLSVKGVRTIIKKLDNSELYTVVAKNLKYDVFEQNYLIYPQSTGELLIEPVVYKVNSGGFDLPPFGVQPYTLFRRSDPVRIEVREEPYTNYAKDWLPANKVLLEEEWNESDAEFRVGSVATRKLKLTAIGQIASQLPIVEMKLPNEFKIYHETPELRDETSGQQIKAIREDSYTIIPQKPGEYILPEIRLAYWSDQEETVREAVLPKKIITVLPDKETTEIPSIDQSGLKDEALTSLNTFENNPVLRFWQMLTMTILFLWLATCALWYRSSRT